MYSKQKAKSHIIERKSLSIIQSILPDYWTIREFNPDYGIDLDVEIFEKSDDVYETLGEHLYIQVKGTEKISFSKIKVSDADGNKSIYIDVVKFSIETSELYTVERMSSAVPVMLFVVDVIGNVIYFICLNDYIEKILIPYEHDYCSNSKKTIYIPIKNKIETTQNCLSIIPIYSKRPKLYSFFNKVNCQNNDLNYISDDDLVDKCKQYTKELLRLDVWSIRKLIILIDKYYEKLINFRQKGVKTLFQGDKNIYDDNEKIWDTSFSYGKLYTKYEAVCFMNLRQLWISMDNFRDYYEEYCRSWFLPIWFNYY